jgi:trk system potassium uptake protein TrkH
MMLVGAAPGGAGGGLKLTTLAVLGVGLAQVLRGRAPGRVFGIAMAWMAALATIVFATFLLLLGLVPEMPADRLLVLAISATGNVGLSHDAVSVARNGAYVLAGAMLLGRVLPLLVLWWLTRLDEPVEVAIG